jgi:hypothetical protein
MTDQGASGKKSWKRRFWSSGGRFSGCTKDPSGSTAIPCFSSYRNDVVCIDNLLISAIRTSGDDAVTFAYPGPIRFGYNLNRHVTFAAPRCNTGNHKDVRFRRAERSILPFVLGL